MGAGAPGPYWPEFELLLCCSRSVVDARSAERARELLAAPLRWELVHRAAVEHGVTPLFCGRLGTVADGLAPQGILASLGERARRAARWNLFCLAETLDLLAELARRDVVAIPFRGPTFAAAVYGNPALREQGAIEILVRDPDLGVAVEAARARGCRDEPSGPTWAETPGRSPAEPSSRRLCFVIHPEVPVLGGRWLAEAEMVWADPHAESIQGHDVFTLPPETLLLSLCAREAAEWHRAWSRLTRVCDVNELLRTYADLDWDLVLHRARRLGCYRMLLAGVGLAAQTFQAAVPVEVRRAIRRDPAILSLIDALRERLCLGPSYPRWAASSARLALKARERLSDKVRYVGRRLSSRSPATGGAARQLLGIRSAPLAAGDRTVTLGGPLSTLSMPA